ncbi:M48 family metallopeptidase [Ramlibacter ginsenosidimutans]|uniref:M48 family metallopeptidase n=1 Tax=Ramlibacter ginsenosidimutans TaxID=502333 RepID=A0A934WKH8_9BURK|nr:M48 family metallopeptidase [Ramlibacter ginsenosidimutans]MBK6004491.1 M48 family metallopeptidase [Ramlibacter ginsenosidimutans]
MTQALAGRWFDGRSSAARAVQVRLHSAPRGPSLALQATDGESLVLSHAQVRWPEQWSARRLPRRVLVDLGARGSLEIDDAAGWQQALAASGHKASVAQRMQTRWSSFALALLAVAAIALAFYRWGTPWAATQLTREVPLAWETSLAERALHDLDARMLRPTQLPAQRQAALRARFAALAAAVPADLRRYPGYQPQLVLQFRRGMPANAFALPGGTIVMTDAIVELADREHLGDDALAGVLAHEMGHVFHRHTTRAVVEQGVLNVGLGLALGDVSWILSTGGSLLTGLAYRREHESEADCFAAALMARTGSGTTPMADLLMKIDQGAGPGAGFGELLSSHPNTPQRAQALRHAAPSCR